MSLADLIRGKPPAEFATATLATPATQRPDTRPPVATVATVAVAKPQPPKLTQGEEAMVRAWLAAINETDPAEIARVLECCRTDPRAIRYVLAELETAPVKSGGKFEAKRRV